MVHRHPAASQRIVGWLLTASLVGASVAGGATAAGAAPEDGGGCDVVHYLFVCGAEVDTAPSGQSAAVGEPTPRPSSGPTAQVVSERFTPTTRAGLCDIGGPNERPMLVRSLLSPTGEVLRSFYFCAEEPEPETAPDVPPAPPSQEELLSAVAIPRLAINSNPSARGLTGLESWFWVSAPGPVSASVNLRGWEVTGTLVTSRWLWHTGDGGAYETTGPGSPDAPAVAHTYETDGTWPVSLSVQWTGSYTVNGYGTDYTVSGLTTVGDAEIDYEVVEARAVLEEAPAGGRS